MRIDFRQGIIKYPSSGSVQKFLTYLGGYVSISCANGNTDVAFAHVTENYLYSESVDVNNAWGPLPANTDCWLYWDINLRTGLRTFGYTTIQPITSIQRPAVVEEQHWFNPSTTTMYVCTAGTYRAVARVFAAKVNNSSFMPLGDVLGAKPFAGSQVGLNTIGTRVGHIIIDDNGSPIRRVDGRLFTTENELFVDGAPVNIVKLDSAVVPVTAETMLPKYHIVKFTDFGKINLATYNDAQDTTLAMLTEDLTTLQTGYVVVQGCVTNPAWNWSALGNLWVDDSGGLTYDDLHLTDPFNHPAAKPPVARVVSSDTVIFDQGMGGIGPRGPAGSAGDVATPVSFGTVKLASSAIDPTNPLVVVNNDPRMTDARTPTAHNQAATTIIPTAYGALTGANLQLTLQQIEDNKLSLTGGTMTGALLLSSDPTSALQAATKSYVDGLQLTAGSGLVLVGNTLSVGTLSIPYDIAFYVPDNPFLASATVSGFLLPREVHVDTAMLDAVVAKCTVAPSNVGGSTLEMYNDAVLIATITFVQGANVGSVVWVGPTLTLLKDSVVTLRTTATVDLTVAGIGITVVGSALAPPRVY